MNTKSLKIIILFSMIATLFLSGCTSEGKLGVKKFKHNTPLIKEDIKKKGRIEVDKTAKMGPQPAEGDVVKLGKRKQISSQRQRAQPANNTTKIPHCFQNPPKCYANENIITSGGAFL